MLIKSGFVVTESGVVEGDIRTDRGVISEIGVSLPPGHEKEVIDARDCYVLPGAIDPHVHITLDGYSTNETMVEDLADASRAALFGGVTTVSCFVQRTPESPLPEMLKREIAFGTANAWTDFAVNAMYLPGDDIDRVVADAAELGVQTFKAYLSYYDKGNMCEDDDLFQLMQAVARVDGLVLIHAENGRLISYLEKVEREKQSMPDRGAFLRAAPAELEAEGICRAALLAKLAGCRLLFVHLTSQLGIEALNWVRCQMRIPNVWAETQPHYMLMTNDAVLWRGALAKVGPPLKHATDVEAVGDAVASGLVSHLSSDHSPRVRAVKLNKENILDAPYGGISGVEVLLPLAFKVGVEEGRFPIEHVARLTSTNAAKRYGLYPGKGTIRIGSDADFAIVPVDGADRAITADNLHGKSDYSFYEGLSSRGFPRWTIRHGTVVMEDGELKARVPAEYLGRRAPVGTSK